MDEEIDQVCCMSLCDYKKLLAKTKKERAAGQKLAASLFIALVPGFCL